MSRPPRWIPGPPAPDPLAEQIASGGACPPSAYPCYSVVYKTMNLTPRTFAGFALLAPLVFGCAGRAAPFNEMDQAQITVLRLQGQEAPPVATAPATTQAPLIPGLPPEIQALGQQALQGLQGVLPPGMIPPGLIPGAPAPAPVVAPQPRFKNFVILAQTQLIDEEIKGEILDIFGDDGSFSKDRGNCFYPGFGISMVRPNSPVPVDLLISFSCNQAMGDGFKWPHPTNGFTSETSQRLSKVYEKLWGLPVPPGA